MVFPNLEQSKIPPMGTCLDNVKNDSLAAAYSIIICLKLQYLSSQSKQQDTSATSRGYQVKWRDRCLITPELKYENSHASRRYPWRLQDTSEQQCACVHHQLASRTDAKP